MDKITNKYTIIIVIILLIGCISFLSSGNVWAEKIKRQIYSVSQTVYENKVTVLGFKISYKTKVYKDEQKVINYIKENEHLYPKDAYLLFDMLWDMNTEQIDAYSLFEYMKSKGYNAYYVVQKSSDRYKELEETGQLKNVIAIDYDVLRYPNKFISDIAPILLRSKAILSSFFNDNREWGKFITSDYSWKYIFIQHGVIYLKESILYNGYMSHDSFNKILVSNDLEANLLKKYNFKDEQFVKAGLPRWDYLSQNSKPKTKSILVMLTYRHFVNGDVESPMETFEQSVYKKNTESLLNNKELNQFLKKHNVTLYYVPHHYTFWAQINSPNIKPISTQEISKYIKESSMLITDFSSVCFDFMFQNKPVIYYLLDMNANDIEEEDKENMRAFEHKKENLANVFYDEKDIVKKIEFYVNNNFTLEPEVKEKYNKFFYTKNNIREKLLIEIDKILEENK